MTARKLLYIIIGQLYRATFQALFNVIGNAYWYTRLIVSGHFRRMRFLKSEYRKMQISQLLDKSVYMHDGISKRGLFRRWPTWTATVTIMIYRAHMMPGNYWISGNCQDFAHLARWYFGDRAKIRIFCPMRLADLDRVHYIADITTIGEKYGLHYHVGIVSNTTFRAETPDQCAFRMLDGADYVWIQ